MLSQLRVYIGYDRQFGEAGAAVTARSLLDHASIPIDIKFLDIDWLRRIGLYTRTSFAQNNQRFDSIDDKPFSTDFSFTRFLVPSLQDQGLALFVDSDFLFKADVADLIERFEDGNAVHCVQHVNLPEGSRKMQNLRQESYRRKNWSSLMMFDCEHKSNRMLTPHVVNTARGGWLHALEWLRDDEIGSYPLKWNWLDGSTILPSNIEPFAVHFTRGTPDMKGWESTHFADDWRAVWDAVRKDNGHHELQHA